MIRQDGAKLLVRHDSFLAIFLVDLDDRVNIHGIVMDTGMHMTDIIDRNAPLHF